MKDKDKLRNNSHYEKFVMLSSPSKLNFKHYVKLRPHIMPKKQSMRTKKPRPKRLKTMPQYNMRFA